MEGLSEYAGTDTSYTDEFFRNLQRGRILERQTDIMDRGSVGQTAIVMKKQSQRSINEQRIIQLPESILLIPAIITI